VKEKTWRPPKPAGTRKFHAPDLPNPNVLPKHYTLCGFFAEIRLAARPEDVTCMRCRTLIIRRVKEALIK
jgi:hypothetical protein